MTLDNTTYKLPNGVVVKNDIDPEKLMARKKRDPDVPNEYDLTFSGGSRSLRIELHLGDVHSMRRQAHAIMRFARLVDEACNAPKLQMATRIMRLRTAQGECRDTCRELSASQELHMKRNWEGTE